MKGVYAAIVTHFDPDLKVDHDAVAAEVRRLIDEGIHGIVPNGSVGEGGSLTPRGAPRRDRDGRRRRRGAGPGVRRDLGYQPPSRRLCTRATRWRRRRRRDVPAAAVLPRRRRELVEFFSSVARATELPLMVYNNPLGSGTDLHPELLALLAREVPAITVFKETSGDARRIAELVEPLPRGRRDGRR